MTVSPVSIAGASTNVTAAMSDVTDALVYGANFFVTNYVGCIVIATFLVGFGVGMIRSMFMRRRGRR